MNREKSRQISIWLSLILILTACDLTTSKPTSTSPIAATKLPTTAPSATIPVPIIRPPLAKDTSINIVQETSASIDLNTLASDPDGDRLTFTINTLPNHGDAHLIGSTLGFTPTTEYVGLDQFIYEVSDGKGGIAQGTVSITVNSIAPPLDMTEVTDFASAIEYLHSGNNPSQTGVVSGTIEPLQATVLRGKVTGRDGKPLVGVDISILGHPEFGQTLTRSSGMFDIVVNGGGWLTVEYAKQGYLSLQRKVNAPWRNYAWLPDVVMALEDANVTQIDLASNNSMQLARGSVISDSDGMRQQTLLFPQGTTAFMTFTSAPTQTLTKLHVHITEYTVGPDGKKMMPGDLPPNSAYTYATEFSADEAIRAGAKSVHFNPPILSYIENYLNFPVGATMPMGYYDRELGAWIAADSGQVVKIANITAGKADLDIDGSGSPASSAALTALGVTDAERTKLAQLYSTGVSLWRVPVPHFSPWDINQGTSCEEPCPSPPPPTPCSTDSGGDPQSDKQTCEAPPTPPEDPDVECRSIIKCQTQTLGEVINIVGTPFRLHYQSDRVPDYKVPNILTIPTRGDTVSPKLQAIKVSVFVAGRRFEQYLPKEQRQYQVVWDGKDASGRYMQGKQPVQVELSYIYPLVYRPTKRFGYNGNNVVALTSDRTSGEFGIATKWLGEIGTWRPSASNLGGWSLDIHHVYDPQNKVLYLGTGEQRSAESLSGNTIKLTAGDGGICSQAGFCVDGIPATATKLHEPYGLAVSPDGQVYISDYAINRVRRVDSNGIITTVAGGGACSVNCDGLPATQLSLTSPRGLAFAPDGSLYVADHSFRLRKIDKNGIVTTVAGTGSAGFSGDDGPAKQAQIGLMYDVAVASDGIVYFTDVNPFTGRARIRRIGNDGLITTIAGGGSKSPIDGISATDVQFLTIHSIAIAPDGQLYISAGNHIGMVDVIGRYHLVTKVGTQCSRPTEACGDGLPAKSAPIGFIEGIDIGPDGTIYLAAQGSHKIRAISPDGIIRTIAGSGNECTKRPCGDDGPALQANLWLPRDIAVEPNGSVYIADSNLNQVRQVTPALPGVRLSDILIPSEDGALVYVFSSSGRHLRTVHALTGATLYEFHYTDDGQLWKIEDGDRNITEFKRDPNGSLVAIVAPFGQQTTVTLDANGYLESVQNPAGETIRMGYSTGGLLTSFRDARNNQHTFDYDSLGRLWHDNDPASGSMTLSRLDSTSAYTVTVTTALSTTTQYRIEKMPNGGQRRVNTYPNRLQDQFEKNNNGTRIYRAPDGTTQSVVLGPDPRWGMLVPINKQVILTTPSGLKLNAQSSRTASLANPANPFSLTKLADTATINGMLYRSTYIATTRTWIESSPLGRVITTTIDPLGRVVYEQIAGLLPAKYDYDSHGRLITATLGLGPSARVASFAYNPQGYLSSITDPMSHTARFDYDLAGRVITQTLADGRVIGYDYDANGNMESLTPPGRPAHTFKYTPVDLPEQYLPPDVNPGADDTQYAYNKDRHLKLLTRPDGQTINIDYDNAGRLDALTIARGLFDYNYEPTTGNLKGISAPGGINLAYGYDGALLKSQSWSGAIAGTAIITYDNHLRWAATDVNSRSPIALQYDDDNLLTQAGALTLIHNPQNGLLTGSTLGSVTDSWEYNGFGEPITYTVSSLLKVLYDRDNLGRISKKTETIQGVTTVYSYTYDLAGRLTDVWQNNALLSHYTYDSNGNRKSYTSPSGAIAANPDAQDRLQSYGPNTYTYTANGELLTKTNGAQTTKYEYDALGNLITVTLPNSTQIEYLIDGQNRRVGKKVNGALTQAFLYESQLRPIAELDGTGSIVSRFVYATRINVPDYMVKDGVTYRLILDHLGSPRLIVDAANGQVVQRMDYDEFGRVLNDTNPGFQPFGFAGGLYDRNTGLVRFGARDYDAETGRWTAKDPIGFDGGDTNQYNYVFNDPLNSVDINGKLAFLIPLIACVGGGCEVAIAAAAAGIAIVGAYVAAQITNSRSESKTRDSAPTCSNSNPERARCREVGERCRDFCSDWALPGRRSDQGMRFQRCVNLCKQDAGCPPNSE